jgi:hypothetical protein
MRTSPERALLVHAPDDGELGRRGDHGRDGPGARVPPGVLARDVDVDLVDVVLDRRHAPAAGGELADQTLHGGRLARVGLADDRDDGDAVRGHGDS